jgi:Uma2 family endonuclease
MKVALDRLTTLKSLLSLQEFKPAIDFYGGRAIQKMSPRLRHSIIQGEMFLKLSEHSRPSKLGRVFPELRCTLGDCSFVFDLSFFQEHRAPRPLPDERADVIIAPDIAIEILSPGQPIGELKQKFKLAIKRGVRLGWLVAPRRKEVHVFRASGRPKILKMGEALSGDEILPKFVLPIEEIFGWLEQD